MKAHKLWIGVILSVLALELVSTVACVLPIVSFDAQYLVPYFSRVATCFKLWSVPFEMFLALTAVAALRTRSAAGRFALSACLAGATTGLLSAAGMSNFAALGSALLSVVAFLIASTDQAVSPTQVMRAARVAARSVVSNPQARATVIASCIVAVSSVVLVHATVQTAMTQEALFSLKLKQYRADLAKIGPRSTENSLEIYSDYQCPSCKQQVPGYRAAAAAAGITNVSVRQFPLDASCNDGAIGHGSIHPVACYAAVAAMFVGDRKPPEKAEFEGWLYAHQTSLSKETIDRQLSAVGLSALTTDEQARFNGIVRQDIARGLAIGIDETPSVVLNGVRIPRVSPKELKKLLLMSQKLRK